VSDAVPFNTTISNERRGAQPHSAHASHGTRDTRCTQHAGPPTPLTRLYQSRLSLRGFHAFTNTGDVGTGPNSRTEQRTYDTLIGIHNAVRCQTRADYRLKVGHPDTTCSIFDMTVGVTYGKLFQNLSNGYIF
jgi:hypothetical protein